MTVTDALRRRDVVLLCGAGISLDPPAGLPDWHELRDGTIRAIAARHPGLAEHVPTLTDAEMLALPGKRGMSHELVAGTVRSHCPGYFASFAALEDGEPNAHHRRLAEAAAAGAVSLIVTTNFDVFIERALEAAGVAFTCCRTAAEFAAFDSEAGGVQLLKIHGCITAPDTIVATVEQETVGLGAAKIAAMDRLLPGRWQVFWGYSGADLKIDLDYLRGQTNRDAAAGLVWSLFADGGFEEVPNAYVAELVGEYGERGLLGHNLLPAAFDEVLGPAAGGPAATVLDAERSALHEAKTERPRGADGVGEGGRRPDRRVPGHRRAAARGRRVGVRAGLRAQRRGSRRRARRRHDAGGAGPVEGSAARARPRGGGDGRRAALAGAGPDARRSPAGWLRP